MKGIRMRETFGSRPTPIRSCTVVFAAIAFLGCESAGTDTPAGTDRIQYEARDSAGIRIVESRWPGSGSGPGWEVGAEPLVSIGSRAASESFQLYQVQDATRLSDGRLVAANGGSNELLVFGDDGSYLGAWGGEGDGPGEFRSLALVRRWGGDSLVAADSGKGQVSVFDLAGAHGRTMLLRGGVAGGARESADAGARRADGVLPDLNIHIALGLLPDGALLTRQSRTTGTQGFWRQAVARSSRAFRCECGASPD